MLLPLLEAVVIALILIVMSTQVIIPIWRGEILFPFFCSKTKKLEHIRAQALDDVSAEEVEKEIDRLNKLLKDKGADSDKPK